MPSLKITGRGAEKVLVLPGLFGANGIFDESFRYADLERFQFVILEYRGFGSAKFEPGLYTFREVVIEAVRLLEYLGWSKSHVMGHSVGALAAQMIAVAAPARVTSIVSLAGLTAKGATYDEARLRALSDAATDIEKRAAIIDASLGRRYTNAVAQAIAGLSVGGIAPVALAKYAEDAMSTDIQHLVEGSLVPMLALVGKHDPINNERVTRETTLKLYRNAVLQVIDAGHYPMIECPALTMSLVEQFFAQISQPKH
jgi:pimeloyl-ACP methyl ester carboxylesterase